ncbi:hypothetical protein L596_000775 [Steinernema carpocapsae]|uniref:Uncharacterized protein n=1 Tax=Steinernema carpocapsae TaxID=34508 RepID=A0A4U8UJW4_STECR|nr:hypothetical protein L596_000775 [Steinernema carpocapsae]
MNIVWFSLLAIALLAPLSAGHISLCFYCPYHSVIPASTFLADFITDNRCLLEYWRSSEPIEGLKGLDPWHNKAELSKRLSNFSIGEADTAGRYWLLYSGSI